MLEGHFPPMHYALIAAGEGSRLREEGISVPKPLVKIQGQPMIERLIGIFMRNGARSISVICNEQMTDVRDFLESLRGSSLLQRIDEQGKVYCCQLNVVVQTTPSSMHSLAVLSEVIPEGRFCLTTVDTVFLESEFSSFIRSFVEMEETKDGLFAVTPFVDDEKPLWVGTTSQKTFSRASDGAPECTHKVIGFYDQESQLPEDAERMVSGGIYCLDTRTVFPVLRHCLAQGQSRMRNFQRALITDGLKLDAYVFPKIMDIDHASDIEKAERWIRKSQKPILCIARDAIYSPNNVEKDAAILHAVAAELRQRGWMVEECSEEEWCQSQSLSRASLYDRIFHMTRRQESLQKLGSVAIPVINRPDSVQITAKSRSKTLATLEEFGIEVPAWVPLPEKTEKNQKNVTQLQSIFPAWLKIMRGDAIQASDVCYLEDSSSLTSRIEPLITDEFVTDVVLMKHVEGELVKCYVVMHKEDDTPRLLKWFRPQTVGYSKFGEAESHNLQLDQLHVDEERLQSLAKRIGIVLDLNVFGFDAIVQPDGTMMVIDVNDWPSFSMCREAAAEAIASIVEQN